jgi:hypothetical protein
MAPKCVLGVVAKKIEHGQKKQCAQLSKHSPSIAAAGVPKGMYGMISLGKTLVQAW